MSTSPSPAAKKAKPPWALLFSISAVVLLALLLFWHQYRQDRAIRELAEKLTAIKAQGYPVSTVELDAWYPEPPAGQNAASLYVQAFQLMVPLPSDSPWYASQSSSNIFHRTNSATLPARTALTSLIISNQTTLQLLHDGAKLTNSRYPVNLSAGYNALLPHLGPLRNANRLLIAEALDHALADRPQAAVDSLITSLHLGHSLSNEPILISHLVQAACYRETVQALENILNRTAIPTEFLPALEAELQRAELSLNLTRAVVGERCMGLEIFENPVATIAGGGSQTLGETFMGSLYKASGLLNQDFQTYLEFMDGYLAASQQPLAERLAAFNEIEQELEQRLAQNRWKMTFTGMIIPALTKTGNKDAAAIAQLRLARLSLMLLTYQDAHDGKFPATLADLTNVPLDPFDGKPLRYRQTETGFHIWSIGPDGIDQNGKPRPRNSSDQAHDLLFTIEFPAATPTK